MQAAWKVGGLVVLFVALLLGCYAILQRSVFAKPTDTYYVTFEDAGGLTSGAKVLLAGVKIGVVTDVSLMDAQMARAVISVEKPFRIPAGCRVALPSSLLSFGDRRIELYPPSRVAGYLSPGTTMVGKLESPLQSIMPEGDKTVAQLNETLLSVNKVLNDPELFGGMKKLLASTNATVTKFGAVAGRVDGMLAQNAPHVASMLASLDRNVQNLESVTGQVRALMASGQLQGRLAVLLNNMDEATRSGKELMAELNALVKDPALRQKLEGTLASAKTMADSGARIAANVEVITANGADASGELKPLLANANLLVGDLRDTVKEFRGALQKLPGVGGKLPKVQVEAEIARQQDPAHNRADINVVVPVGARAVRFGLYDAFESNKLNLQLQQEALRGMDLRYGVYAGKPAVGVDYRIAPGFWLRNDVFGLNDPQYDARVGFNIGGGLSGWVGLERIFQDNSPAVGIGFRR